MGRKGASLLTKKKAMRKAVRILQEGDYLEFQATDKYHCFTFIAKGDFIELDSSDLDQRVKLLIDKEQARKLVEWINKRVG